MHSAASINGFSLIPLTPDKLNVFRYNMQEAFQKGAEAEFGKSDEPILPEEDIDRSLAAKGSAAYMAVYENKLVGGAIVIIDDETHHNHLDFLYVKDGFQSKGIGLKIWKELERLYPETEIWETVTPYFEKRNLHFYINNCGFHAVEFYNPHHKDPNDPSNEEDDEYFGYFFRFEKKMR